VKIRVDCILASKLGRDTEFWTSRSREFQPVIADENKAGFGNREALQGNYVKFPLNSEAPEAQAEPHTHIGKKRKAMIFSWLSWIAVVLVGAYARWRRRRRRSCVRQAALVYRVLLWYWTSMLWSIDNCQDNVSTDQYHVTISRTQVYSSSGSPGFWSWPLTKCWFSIRSRAHVRLTCWKAGQDYSEAG